VLSSFTQSRMEDLWQSQLHNNFFTLTQAVSCFHGPARLQMLKCLKSGESWLLRMEFFPEPGDVLWGRRVDPAVSASERVGMLVGERGGTAASPHPIQLYAKAHFLNQRITGVMAEGDDALRFEFATPGLALRLQLKGTQGEITFEVPERKPYRQKFALGGLPAPRPRPTEEPAGEVESRAAASGQLSPDLGGDPVSARPRTPEERKQARLLANIADDIRASEAWLAQWTPLLDRLRADPGLWKRPEEFSVPERALLETEINEGHLPSFGREGAAGSTAGRALEALFDRRRKAERRIAGGRKRLAKVESRALPFSTAADISGTALIKEASPASLAAKSRPRKKPGVWVELKPGIWARVGRSASDNEELFRQSRDRDVWFHVRGGTGSHVWLPRGQAGFGAKAELTEELIRLGCQLALINSKSARSGYAVVDFTERRNLRRIRTAVGAVEILRSETRATDLDREFEKRVMQGDE
jgi:hypothetical protein